MTPSKNWQIWSRQTFWIFGFAVLFLFAASTVAVRAFSLLRAASVIYGFSPTPAPLVVRAYTKLFRHSIAEKDFFVPGHDRPVPVRMIFPSDSPDAPIVVLVHGLAAEGNRDGLLNVYAYHLAQIGLRVVIPNISSEQQRLMRPDALEYIGAAIQWSVAASRQRVALFGISFGGGLAIATADMAQYANMLKLVFSDAGFNSTDRLGRYYIGDRVKTPDGRPYRESPPDLGPLLIALQYLDDMVPEQEVPLFRKVILAQITVPSGGTASLNALTPSERALFEDLRTVGSPAMREKYHQLLERNQAEQATVSPHNHMQGLRAPLYILHGANDNSIPPGEAEWTASEVPPGKEVHILITPWMEHAVLRGHVSLLEKIRIGNFVCQVLNATFRPAPL